MCYTVYLYVFVVRPGRSILPEPGPDAAERDSRTVMVMQVGAHTSERDIEHFFLKVGQVCGYMLY